jgi:hypothetical protein
MVIASSKYDIHTRQAAQNDFIDAWRDLIIKENPEIFGTFYGQNLTSKKIKELFSLLLLDNKRGF